MADRPILFSGPMVRAILEGRKTLTRRVLKPQPQFHADGGPGWYPDGDAKRRKHYGTLAHFIRGMPMDFCPYGVPGDRLWVRERHCFLDVVKSSLSSFPLGPQNGNERGPDVWNLSIEYSDGSEDDTSVEGEKPKQTRERGEIRWRPGIHMPRWACRLVLEVTAVRVERLQEISEEDALAEGISQTHAVEKGDGMARQNYSFLWDYLNASRAPWSSNPWVWVVEFERCR